MKNVLKNFSGLVKTSGAMMRTNFIVTLLHWQEDLNNG